MKETIIAALEDQPFLTREQLLELAWQTLDEALAQLLEECKIEIEPHVPAQSHMDRFRLA